MAFIEVEPGVEIYVESWGEGPPVVFVHGGGVTHEFWEHQVAALMGRFRVVTFDLRGCGRSSRPSRGYGVDVWAGDLARLVDGLDLDRPAIVGHALGAHIALRFATNHPQRLSKLAIVSGAPCGLGAQEETGGFSEAMWSGLTHGLTTNRPQAELDLADAFYFHADPGEGMRLWALHMALQWANGVYMQLFESFPSLDHRDRLGDLPVPVLVAHGRHDRKNRYEGATYLTEHLPDARLVTFEASAHCPPLEEGERFNDTLAAFLLEVPGADDGRHAIEAAAS
jgi:pimeloyl-ACP methyl ester carboxylesterase